MEHTSDSIGIIGLGIIGSRVAERLRQEGKHVYCWSPTARAIPNFLAGPAEIATMTKTVQLFVRDGDALISVAEAIRDELTHEHIVINCATVSPEATRKAASIVQGSAAAFLDCPFTGSRSAAETGALVYFVGGNKDVLDRARGVLEISGDEIIHVGEIGHATTLKLATNLIGATQAAALAEALAITRSQGLSGEKLLRAIEASAVRSALISFKLPAMIARDYEPHFSLKNMLKDARYALEIAGAASVDLPVLTQVAHLMDDTMTGDHPDQDFAVINERYQK